MTQPPSVPRLRGALPGAPAWCLLQAPAEQSPRHQRLRPQPHWATSGWDGEVAWGGLPSLQSVATQGRAGRWGGGLSHQPQHGGGHLGRPRVQVQTAPLPATSLPHLGAGGASLEGGVPWYPESLARTTQPLPSSQARRTDPPGMCMSRRERREPCAPAVLPGPHRTGGGQLHTPDGQQGRRPRTRPPTSPSSPRVHLPFHWNFVWRRAAPPSGLSSGSSGSSFLSRSRCPCSHPRGACCPGPLPPQQLPLELEMCPAPPAE